MLAERFRSRDRSIWLVSLLVVALSVADGVVTVWGIRSGLVHEANPLLAGWVGSFVFWLLKLVIPAGLCAWVMLRCAGDRRKARHVLGLLVLGGVLVVGWNLYAILGGV